MNILGLHFGHDASVTVLADGRIAAHVLAERQRRIKHAVGLTEADIQRALDAAGLVVADLDSAALVSTQDMEMLVGLAGDLDIALGATAAHPYPSPITGLVGPPAAVERLLSFGLKGVFGAGNDAEGIAREHWARLLPEWRDYAAGRLRAVGWLNAFATHERWAARRGLEDLRSEPVPRALFGDAGRLGMHYPVTLRLQGRAVPACLVDHHVCHGASSYYRSGFERAAVMTHDGGDPGRGLSGLFLYGEGHRLHVLGPHHLALGGIYRGAGIALGFDPWGAEGKLMGLSSYGAPRFFDSRYTGNGFDIQRRTGESPSRAWRAHCVSVAAARGYDTSHGHPQHLLSPFGRDFAASTQKLFEETWLRAAEVLEEMLRRHDRGTTRLALSGGCALNCPGNSRLYNEGPFRQLFVEPNCDDGGLSAGAALFVHHNLLGLELDPAAVSWNASPFRGPPVRPADLEAALAEAGAAFGLSAPVDPAAAAAEDLAADRVVAWFEGSSEMGPRALCHRSLLANPARAANWARVNRIKGREAWRPFAPAVSEAESARWFADCPAASPYMLFTARVRSDGLPAITHVDGSARVQTVGPGDGGISRLLERLGELTGVPVVLNTSLNGPGEPIVESPAEALALFRSSAPDVLYLEGRRIAR